MDDNTLHFIQFTAEPRKTMIHTRQLNSIKILNDAFLTHKLLKNSFIVLHLLCENARNKTQLAVIENLLSGREQLGMTVK